MIRLLKQTSILTALMAALAAAPLAFGQAVPADKPAAPAAVQPPGSPAIANPAADPFAPAAPATPVPAASPVATKAFLWEVKSKTNTVYLFGTVHVGKNSFYPLPDAVENAFEESVKLAVEADITNQDAITESAPLMMYKAPANLENQVSPAVLQRLKKYAAANQMPYEAFKTLKPFLLGGLLVLTEFAKQGYDQRYGVDGYLIQKAVLKAKPVIELESVSEQMKMLAGLNKQEQEAFLDNALSTVEKGKAAAQIEGMIAAWQSGNAEMMESTVKAANEGMKMTAALDEKVLYGRNAKMTGKIEGFLRGSDKHFVAVGSMHLVGKRGIVEALKAKGYDVKQL